MHFLLALVTALCFGVPAKAEIQCMARYGGGFWSALKSTGDEMTATHCASSLSYTYENSQEAYRLHSGPVTSPQQITCQWTWVPSGREGFLPPESVPASIICNFFPSRFE